MDVDARNSKGVRKREDSRIAFRRTARKMDGAIALNERNEAWKKDSSAQVEGGRYLTKWSSSFRNLFEQFLPFFPSPSTANISFLAS